MTDRLSMAIKLLSNTIDMIRSDANPTEIITDLREQLQALREDLLAAREEIATLREEKLEVEERLAHALGKMVNLEGYRRTTLAPGSVVYVEKGITDSTLESPTYFCAHCLHEGRESILQMKQEQFHRDIYECNACGATILVPNNKGMDAETIPRSDNLPDY